MIYDTYNGIQTQTAFADSGMPVLVRACRVEAVIDVQSAQLFQAYDVVKLLQHPVKIIYDIIACVADMACVQADPYLVLYLDTVNYSRKLLEPAADLTALAGHGLQQYHRALLRRDYPVEKLRYQSYTCLDALSHMASRMKVVIVPRDVLHPLHIVLHRSICERSDLFCRRTRIQRIRRMGHQLREAVLFRQLKEPLHIPRIYFLRPAPSGVSCKKLKRIRTDAQRIFSHMLKALYGR